jgi:hypothetical protein
MPWFPDFIAAVELERRQTRAAGRADQVGQYFTALKAALDVGDTDAIVNSFAPDRYDREPIGPHATHRRASELRSFFAGGRRCGDSAILPLVGVYKPIWAYDAQTLANDLSAHLVFGSTTSAVFAALTRERP